MNSVGIYQDEGRIRGGEMLKQKRQELYFVHGKSDKLIRGQAEILNLQPKDKVRVQVTVT